MHETPLTFCTVFLARQQARVSVLAEALENLHPGVKLRGLSLDAAPVPSSDSGPWDVPESILPQERLGRLLFSSGSSLAAAALLPAYLSKLRAETAGPLIYLSPDCFPLAPLDPLVAATQSGAGITLVPRLKAPITPDPHFPGESFAVRDGWCHPALIGVANSDPARTILAWWASRVESLFTPPEAFPRLPDLMPALFEHVCLLRHRGCGASAWNLAPGDLTRDAGGRLLAAGEPVVVFDFEGFDPDHSEALHAGSRRLRTTADPALEPLAADYARRLRNAGHARHATAPSRWDAFSNGVAIDSLMRRLLRECEAEGRRFADPFDAATSPGFYAWLNGPVRGQPGRDPGCITHYLQHFHAGRPDLHAAFPTFLTRQRSAFLRWVATDGVRQGIPVEFARAAGALPAATPAPARTPPGVNVLGYVQSESGLGESARGYLAAIEMLGMPVAVRAWRKGSPSRAGDHSLGGIGEDAPHAINLICINADHLPSAVQDVGESFFDGHFNIGVWWWELGELPADWAPSFSRVSEIWCGSRFLCEAIGRVSPVPVVHIPPVVLSPAREPYARRDFNLADDEFVFLYVFDAASVLERKNPMAAVRAFRRAFAPGEPARLVLKGMNGEQDADGMRKLEREAEGARVTLIDTTVSAGRKAGLMTLCDAYVSPHRAEGFGLTIAEAMAAGKPVIATGWSGNMDLMTVNNSYPVRFDLVPLGRWHGPYAPNQLWAEPDTEHMAHLMRHVYEHRPEAAAVGARGAADVARFHSPEAVARILSPHLAAIEGRIRAATSERPAPAASLQRLKRRLRRGP